MDHVTPACARNICNSTSELEIMEIIRGVISAVFIKKGNYVSSEAEGLILH